MDLVDTNNKCTGCSLCAFVCKQKAITLMMKDGFYKPTIDVKKCINCGLCVNNCHSIKRQIEKDESKEQRFFAVINKDLEELSQSTSGGVFYLLSKQYIHEGGYVCGAVFSDDYKNVDHIVTNEIDKIKKMRQAKYVQSFVQNAFLDIINLVNSGSKVMFCGTPCQVYALSKIIPPQKKNKLLLVDIVCHGYPSPLAWKEFVSFLNAKKGQIENFSFRDKRFGWRGVNCTASFIGNKKIYHNTQLISSYSNLYFGHYITAIGCGECKFATFPRVCSDITIGDYWGIENIQSPFNDNKGVSLVIINSDKGLRAFTQLHNKIDYLETSFKECKQPQLLHPSLQNVSSEEVMSLINNNKYEYAIKKYGGYNCKNKLKSFVKRIIKKKK